MWYTRQNERAIVLHYNYYNVYFFWPVFVLGQYVKPKLNCALIFYWHVEFLSPFHSVINVKFFLTFHLLLRGVMASQQDILLVYYFLWFPADGDIVIYAMSLLVKVNVRAWKCEDLYLLCVAADLENKQGLLLHKFLHACLLSSTSIQSRLLRKH